MPLRFSPLSFRAAILMTLALQLPLAKSAFAQETPSGEKVYIPPPERRPELERSPFGPMGLSMNEQSRNQPAPKVLFFPPNSPVLDAAIPVHQIARVVFNGRAIETPEDLSSYVNEYFYPALASRLFTSALSEKLESQLAAYRSARATLLNELTGKLDALALLDPARRENELRAFAREQASRLAALEREAEQLREELIRGNWWQGSIDWRSSRNWRLGETKFVSEARATNAEFLVVRGSAFFDPGLGPEQRGMLREIAMELEEKGRPLRPGLPSSSSTLTAMFFSPESSRFTLPKNLPPALIAKFAAYNRDKLALKDELRTTVYELDRASVSQRAKALAALAESQWPRVRTLEELAEDIRRHLATLPPPPAPALGPRLPASLVTRIENYRRDRATLNAEFAQQTRIPMPRLPVFTNASPEERSLHFREAVAQRAEQVQTTAERFKVEHASRYAALQETLVSIRQELAAFARTHPDPATGKPMDPDALMQAFNAAAQEFEKIGRREALYKNYETAVFQPGLSPEQRRLLFGAGLVNLSQALPPGEIQSELPSQAGRP